MLLELTHERLFICAPALPPTSIKATSIDITKIRYLGRMNSAASLLRQTPAFLLLLCMLLLPGPAFAPEVVEKNPAPEPGLSATAARLSQDFDAFFQENMPHIGPAGAAVALVYEGKIILLKGYGMRNAQKQLPVDAHTVFRLGSVSKGFAGVLTGMLAQEGRIHWDDRVQTYFPDFQLSDPEQSRRMQIRHLLSQTTGLPYHAFTNLIEKGYSLDRIVREYFPKAPLSAPEGQFYSYQNAAFSLIQPVLENATHQSYDELVQQYLFNPSGMLDASSSYQAMCATENKSLPHAFTGAGWRPTTLDSGYYDFTPAGGINASISDMSRWLLYLLGQIENKIPDETLDTVFTPVISTDKERRLFPHWIGRSDAYYAMGWRVLKQGNKSYMYHGGYVNGYRTEIALDRSGKNGICVLFNAATPLCSKVVPQFFQQVDQMGAR
ncbi:MAG: beta-lactamase family protein [Bacteroidetes bacterium]|nr:beta-lactamase family protein [Bacteroidota bacterium]